MQSQLSASPHSRAAPFPPPSLCPCPGLLSEPPPPALGSPGCAVPSGSLPHLLLGSVCCCPLGTLLAMVSLVPTRSLTSLHCCSPAGCARGCLPRGSTLWFCSHFSMCFLCSSTGRVEVTASAGSGSWGSSSAPWWEVVSLFDSISTLHTCY